MIIALLGPPGAGKGTQAAELVKTGQYRTFSVGAILRQSDNPEVVHARDSGELVNPQIVVDVVVAEIAKVGSDIRLLMDGFPRNLEQVRIFDTELAELKRKLDVAIWLNVPRKVSEQRLRLRFEQEHRTDDEPAVMARRFKVYETETMPIVDYYREHGILSEVDGLGTVAEVLARMQKVLNAT